MRSATESLWAGGAADAVEDRRAAQLVEHRQGCVVIDWASRWRRRRGPRSGGHRARPRPRARTKRPAAAHDELDPGSAMGCTSRPASVQAMAASAGEERLRGGPDDVVTGEPEPDQAEVALVGDVRGIDLEGDRSRRERSRCRDCRIDASERSRSSPRCLPLEAAPGCGLRGLHQRTVSGRSAGRCLDGRRPAEAERRPVSRESRPVTRATGHRSSRRARAPSQRATEAIAVNASDAPEQRRAIALLVEHGLGLWRRPRGQRHVHRQDVRPVARRGEQLGRSRRPPSPRRHRFVREVVDQHEHVVGVGCGHRSEARAVGRGRVVGAPRIQRIAGCSPSWAGAPGSAPGPPRGAAAGRARSAARGPRRARPRR